MPPETRIIRHPGESRDPVCKIAFNIHFKHWIPAFAGMTKMSVHGDYRNY